VKIIAVHNFKGGVGKTTAAVDLAYESALAGRRTLLWDLDPQGAASFCLRVVCELPARGKTLLREPASLGAAVRGTDFERFDLLPADFSLRRLDAWLEGHRRPERFLAAAMEELASDHDLIIVDCAPTLSALNESVFAACDAVLVPTIPTVLSLRTVARLLAHLKPLRRRGLKALPFLSMVDRRKALHRQVCAWVREHDLGFLATEIPFASIVERASVERRPLGSVSPGSPAARAFRELLREVEAKLAAGSGAERGARPKAVRHLVEDLEHGRGVPKPRGSS
jgi:chromosome partitioning protein